MRLILAVVAAAAVGAVGAVILGEYTFGGVTVLASGLVFGLLIGEAALGVHRGPRPALGVLCAAIGLAAMVWAGWIASGHDLSFVGPAGWMAVVLAGAGAGLRTGWSRRAAGTAPEEPARGSAPS